MGYIETISKYINSYYFILAAVSRKQSEGVHPLLIIPEVDPLEQLANRSKSTERLNKQAKLHSLKYSPRYKYGFEIPKNYKDAERLDGKNDNYDGMDANKLEHEQL